MENKTSVLQMDQEELEQAYESIISSGRGDDKRLQQVYGRHGQFERTSILRDTDIMYSFTTATKEG